MRSKALSFLRQVLRRSLTQGTQYLGLCWGAWEEFPCALALQRALGEALLACGPQQAAPRITEATFEFVVCSRQARDIIAVEQPRPIAPADLVQVQAKALQGWGDIGQAQHRIELGAQLPCHLRSRHRERGHGF